MAEICKRRDVTVVQGDVLEVYFELIGIAPEIVKNVYFTSKKANLNFPCPFSTSNNAYCLRLPSECTEHIHPIICNYDLTIEFVDGNRMTVLYECRFAVLKKRNSIEGDYGDDG